MKPIPSEWIRQYLDELLEMAKAYKPGTAMREAILLRVNHIMDMVEAWKEKD